MPSLSSDSVLHNAYGKEPLGNGISLPVKRADSLNRCGKFGFFVHSAVATNDSRPEAHRARASTVEAYKRCHAGRLEQLHPIVLALGRDGTPPGPISPMVHEGKTLCATVQTFYSFGQAPFSAAATSRTRSGSRKLLD